MKTPENYEDKIRYVAKQRVKRRKKFYSNLITYMGVIGLLFFINMRTAPGRWWFLFVAVPWGIALLIDYIKAFGIPFIGAIDEEWEHKAIQREMERLSRKHPSGKQQNTLPDGQEWPDIPEEELEKRSGRRPPEEDELV